MAESLFDLTAWKSWARTELSKDDGLNLDAGLAASTHLGTLAGRQLNWIDVGATTATARTFRPWGPCTTILPIDDAATISTVTESGSTLAVDTAYIAEPYGNRSTSGEWRPYDHLIRVDSYWYVDGVRRTITVTAKWGWSSIPALAVEGVKVLAQDWATQRNSSNGVIGATSEGFSIGMRDNPMVKQAINAIRGAKAVPFA